MITTQIKIQDLLENLNTTDTASLIHTASEAIRQCCSFARAYFDLGMYICELDCDGFVSDTRSVTPRAYRIKDIRDERELVNLIIAAAFRLQSLIK